MGFRMKSMTGYSEKQFKISNYGLQCEIKTINGRFLTTNLTLPDFLSSIEMDILSLVKLKISRGAFYLKLILTEEIIFEKLSYDYNLISEDLNTIRNFTALVSLEEPRLSDILAVFNPFKKVKTTIISTDEKKKILKKIESVLDDLVLYRKREGELLKIDLLNRINIVEGLTKELMKELDLSEDKIKKSLTEKIKSLKSDIDENRMAQEIIYYLNKYDFSEEITRLNAHIEIFRTTSEKENIGRKLDFILQEMNREVNTIGSKARFKEISKIVILLKTEIEKIKEQVQNVE